ncbi:MAG: 30S ribosomal protein S3 [Fimbriimonadaceae bacterium]|nr:30S ribosomal protein S3 [Fimbriimonadaceae bacterium]QYK58924.1 MAG: 30S ribosomal protein S3 [Fimbriimonadaceae bacterium]
MGQKIHPVGFRLGVIRGHDSHWYASKKDYRHLVVSDQKVRKYVRDKIGKGLISRVEVERAADRIKVTIFTSRPGAVIGRGGKGIDEISNELNRMLRKESSTAVVQVNVAEVRQPELDAQLVAENIAMQLERRISHRRAMRQSMTRAQRMNARGMKIIVSGRLNGAEIARVEQDRIGKVPLHTLRADIDYGYAIAHTIAGSVGVRVWIYKGEVLPEKQLMASLAAEAASDSRRPRRDRGDGGYDRPRGDRPPRREGRGPRPGNEESGAEPTRTEVTTHVDA